MTERQRIAPFELDPDRADRLEVVPPEAPPPPVLVEPAAVVPRSRRPWLRLFFGGEIQAFLARLSAAHLEAVAAEVPLHGAAQRGLVVDHQDAGAVTSMAAHAASVPSGISKLKRAPPSGRFSAQIRPP